MKFGEKNIVYFLGIGGIGMSALARWFLSENYSVAGYDRTSTELTKALAKEGISVNYTDTIDSIPDKVRGNPASVLVIYTPAIPAENAQLAFFRENSFEIFKRSEILGKITGEHYTIAVAGTHGKTTTSSMIAHILNSANKKVLAFIGGVMQNYNSNILLNLSGEGKTVVVVEADEYDRSFLKLTPDIGVVTTADADHLDIYGNLETMHQAYREFVNRIRERGTLIIKKGLAGLLLPDNRTDINWHEYNLSHSSIRAENLRTEKEDFRFDYIHPDEHIENIPLSVPGFHNVENAVAAITVCLNFGLNGSIIKQGLSTYRGVKRRFEYVLLTPQVVFIDDYAHHPEEIRALLNSVKNIYPDKNILAVFQPHLFSRTRDFAQEFAESLSVANEVILLDIYPAREKPIPGITASLLLDLIQIEKKSICSREELPGVVREKMFDVIVTIGAGDIDNLVEPIKNILLEKYEAAQ